MSGNVAGMTDPMIDIRAEPTNVLLNIVFPSGAIQRLWMDRATDTVVFDFVRPDKKTARVRLTEETVSRLGRVERFDSDPMVP